MGTEDNRVGDRDHAARLPRRTARVWRVGGELYAACRDVGSAGVAVLVAVAATAWLVLLHEGSIARFLQEAVGAWPLALIVLALLRVAGTRVEVAGRGPAALIWAVSGGVLFAAALVPAGAVLFVATGDAHGLGHLARDAAATIPITTAVLLAAALRPGRVPLGTSDISAARRPGSVTPGVTSARRRPASPLARHFVAATLTLSLLAGTFTITPTATPAAEATTDPCASPSRTYEVEAISLDIPYNRFGTVNPNGRMYVLSGDSAAVKNWHVPLGRDASGALDPSLDPAEANNRRLRPRPLVLRANAGECVEVTFTNKLDHDPGEGLASSPRASIAVHGPAFDVQTSDGSRVGYNDDSTVAIGETITYRWLAPDSEGVFLFRDLGTPAGSESDGGANAHGLHGAFVVEPSGSRWYDPVSGQPLYDGTGDVSGELYIDAVIVPASGPAFRETVQISQDEIPSIGMGFNYGADGVGSRADYDTRCPDCVGEETWLSSWAYGDPAAVKLAAGPGPWDLPTSGPAVGGEDCGLESVTVDGYTAADAAEVAPWASCWTTAVTRAYVGDPTKIRFLHAGPKETHVFHLHAHRWRRDPNHPGSQVIDSQTYGPGEGFTADLQGGAGGLSGTVGDAIFHCHLYPHFAEGFWALLRVLDVLEDGSASHPDGTRVRAVVPLPDRPLPRVGSEFDPGFPRFIPGRYGWRAAQPPGSVSVPSGLPDDPATTAREDLRPATRHIAGSALDATLLDATQTVTPTGEGRPVPDGLSLWLDHSEAPDTGSPGSDGTLERFEQDAAGIEYVGTWIPLSHPQRSGGSMLYADAPGSYAELTVEGPSFRWIGSRGPSRGIAAVLVDGVEVATFDLYAPQWSYQQVLFETDDLDAGATIRLVNTGDRHPSSAAARIEVDAIELLVGWEPPSDGGPDVPATFVLTDGVDETPPLPADIDASDLADALTLLLGSDVEVDGSGTEDDPWLIRVVAGGEVPIATGSVSDNLEVHLEPRMGVDDHWEVVFTTTRYGAEMTVPLGPAASAHELRDALLALDGIERVAVSGDDGGPFEVQLQLWSSTDDPILSGTGIEVTPSREDLTDPDTADIAYQLALEREARLRAHDVELQEDGTAPPLPVGSPLVDPCPDGAREVTYDLSLIQLPIRYNDQQWTDLQGRIMVRTEDVDDVIAGRKRPEPLFFRVNAGDCVVVNTTNLLPSRIGGDDFLTRQVTNMFGQHIHLVRYDMLGSDGGANGWNYQQAAYTRDLVKYHDDVLAGSATCDENGCRPTTLSPYSPTWTCQQAGGCPVGQTITARWYADTVLDTVFTHDHLFAAIDQNRGLFGALIVEPPGFDVRDPRTGRFLQPINHNGTPCGASCKGEAVGAIVDMISPKRGGDFREFGVAIQDFVPVYRPCSGAGCASSRVPGWEPIEAPGAPEIYPDSDPGVYAINYRSAPLRERQSAGGAWSDPAYQFSSTVHGDPETPLLRGYAGDPVRVRALAGSHEEQHVLQFHGLRWRTEPGIPDSPLINAQAIGISEAFNFEIPPMECSKNEPCQGDYLYGVTATEGLWMGAWGILRVHGGEVSDLRPLPDNVPKRKANREGTVTGRPPNGPTDAGRVCPKQAPIREIDVVAVDARIDYDDHGSHDPYGLVYARVRSGESPASAAARVRAGNPTPLVLRAEEGDCLRVRLHNRIDPAGRFATEHAPSGTATGDFAVPTERADGTRAGLRVSLHPSLVRYDVRYSDGAVVGFNGDQTVAPGQSRTYVWYADAVAPGELGSIVLTDYGDVRGHRHHGLFAGLIIEPKGAVWHDQLTGEVQLDGATADVRMPDGSGFREQVVFFQDGLSLRDADGNLLSPHLDHGLMPEPVDLGFKALNYRRADLHSRVGRAPSDDLDDLVGLDLAHSFASPLHGDPTTPILRGYRGDPARLRVLQGADRGRQGTFQVAGHGWLDRPWDPTSRWIGTRGGLSVGTSTDIHLPALASGPGRAGDHRYSNGIAYHHLSGGQWGLIRVYDAPSGAWSGSPDALRPVDDPRASGYGPLWPLHILPGVSEPTDPDPPAPDPDPDPPAPDPDPDPPPPPPPPDPDPPSGPATVEATHLTVVAISGTQVAGSTSSLASVDGQVLAMASTTDRQAVLVWDLVSQVDGPVGHTDRLRLRVTGEASARLQSRTVQVYDNVAHRWVEAISDRQGPGVETVVAELGDPARFVDGQGRIRVRTDARRQQGAFQQRTDAVQIVFERSAS